MFFDVATKQFREPDREPGKLAFAGSDRDITWKELKELSDRICERFQEIGIPAGSPVLVYGNKELFFLAALLSCYRKNLPFIPVGPELPAKRVENIIQQTGSNVIIICGAYEEAPILPVTIQADGHPVSSSLVKWERAYPGTAYILFTSGSSGEPKGVLVSDKNLSAFVRWFTSKFLINQETVFINQASFVFDIALADLFGTLQTGGTGIFTPAAQPALFFERLRKYKGSWWNSTPSFVSTLLPDKTFTAAAYPTITHFVLSGEQLGVPLVKELKTRFPNASVINAYGPTETSIFASFAEIKKEMLEGNILPIAKLPAEDIWVENGEININGDKVGQGYLDLPDLTEEKFAEGKFRTGDQGYEQNGYLYVKGRSDDQIKFNGYRIELNEIRNALGKLEGVLRAECLPLEVEGRIKRLLAFVQYKDHGGTSVAEMKKHLRQSLPEWMIPSEIIAVKEFPHTPSFKIDRKKLLQHYLDGSY